MAEPAQLHHDSPFKVLELFSGIGGAALALQGIGEIVAAVDVNQKAMQVYQHNFAHATLVKTIESISDDDFLSWRSDFWWMSPPCQPFTRRGLHRDLNDPRCSALKRLILAVDRVRPNWLMLENVPPFLDSQAAALFRETLKGARYQFVELVKCPTELGIPNRRRRYYLIASRDSSRRLSAETFAFAPIPLRCLSEFIDLDASNEQQIPAAWTEGYASALDVVHSHSHCTNCFTSAYGRSPVRSGSYLATTRGPRFFSPVEVSRFLGFPPDFVLPSTRNGLDAYQLLGNSISVTMARTLIFRALTS